MSVKNKTFCLFICLCLQGSNQEFVSLWTVKLFPVFHGCRDSVCHAINMIHVLKSGNKVQGDVKPVGKYLSMEDVLAFKDIKGTLNIRENLRRKILEN